jgi:tetratricopeptide (TPR) repeat protein
VAESGGIVTILFTDVVNSTELLGRLGDDRAESLRRSHFTALRDVIAEHGGTEVKTMGDGFMVVFASAVDAARCAVSMQQAVSHESVELRIGLHVGEPMREGGDYFGTPVVVASRLCDAAGGGQILTSDLVHALVGSRGELQFHDAGFLALKGLEEPVAAWEVDWQLAEGEQISLPTQLSAGERLPFVGRDELLDDLKIQWKKAQGGHRALVMLAGEPGIGKTRLAAEFAQHAHQDGAIVLFGHADEETLLPYQPFVEAFHHVVRETPVEKLHSLLGPHAAELGRLLPSLHDRLPGLPEPMRSEPESERFRLFEAATDLVASLAATAPVVLVLDDLHWADKPTLLLLHHLFRAPTDLGLLVVGTYRDTDLDRRHPLAETLADLRRLVQFERVAVGGLREADLTRFIDLLTGKEPPLDFARAVHDQTEGNPFFIGEVLRHLIESGAVSVLDGEWVPTVELEELGIPEGVKEVIGRRLTRLSDDANTALAVAAVAGRDFDLDVMERVTELGEDAVLAALDEAVSARLVVELPGPISRFHFAHALVRETLYDELTTARRVRMHRRIAQTIEGLHGDDPEPPLAQLAYHWFEAASAGDVDKAVDYSRRAGKQALCQLASEEAVGHFENALQALDLSDTDDLGARCDVLIDLADARDHTGETSLAKSTYQQAIELARKLDDPHRFAWAAMGFAGNFDVGAMHRDIVSLLDEADRRFGALETGARSRALSRLSMEFYFAEDRSRLRPLASGALDMARRVGDRAAEGFALNMVFALHDGLDQVETRLELTREALRIGRETNDANVEHWGRTFHGFALLEVGDVAAFEREVEAGEALNATVRLPSIAWYPSLWRAALASMRGDLAEFERCSIEALMLGQAAEDPVSLQMFGVQIYALRREQGRLSEVEPTIRGMVDEFPAIPAWRMGLALLLAEEARDVEAGEQLDVCGIHRFADQPDDANWPTTMALVADTAFLIGAADHAAVAYELFAPYAHRFIAIGQCADWYGSVARCLGELAATCGRLEEAVSHFEHGIAADENRGGLRMAIRGKWGLAHTLLRRDGPGDRDRAAELVAEALPTADRLGLVVLAERLRGLGQ